MQAGTEYLYLPPLVFVFLIIDLLIEVDSIKALLSNPFFWLYWLIYSLAAEAALYFLSNGAHPAIAHLPVALLIAIAIVGTTTILQSLTFKVGGKRLFDFSRYLDDYRRKVLSSSASMVTRFERRRVLRQSAAILRKVGYRPGETASEEQMQRIYAEVMLFGARKPERVQQEIEKIRENCRLTGASFGQEAAERVALADPEWVRNFLSAR